MNNVTLGYELQHEDGKIEFTPVFEGDKQVLEILKNYIGHTEYHGKKRIAGCRWVIRPTEATA